MCGTKKRINGALQEILFMIHRNYLYLTFHRFVLNGQFYYKSAHMSCLCEVILSTINYDLSEYVIYLCLFFTDLFLILVFIFLKKDKKL